MYGTLWRLSGERTQLGIFLDGAGRGAGLERALQPVQRAVPFAGAQVGARGHHRGIGTLPERVAAAGVEPGGLVVSARQLDPGTDAQAGRLPVGALSVL